MPTSALRLVAYITSPPASKWLQRALLTVSYSLAVMTGLRSLELHGGVLLDLSGAVMILGALVALFGAMGRLYNIESIGLYLILAGLSGGAIWISGEGAWYTAYVIGAVASLFGLRLQTLARIGHALASQHRKMQGGG